MEDLVKSQVLFVFQGVGELVVFEVGSVFLYM